MITVKKRGRYKPLYRKFLLYRGNVQNRLKFLTDYRKLRKKKWDKFMFYVLKARKFYKRFQTRDHNLFKLNKYASPNNSIKKLFKRELHASKRFTLFYGGFVKKYLKRHLKYILKKKNKKDKFYHNNNKSILEFFESRLDSILFRAHFTMSMKNSRQLITHGHILINGKIETNYSNILKTGDIIEIKSNSYKIIKKNLRNKEFWPIPPKHLQINYKTLQIIFGDITESNLSGSFKFWLDLYSVSKHYQRR